MHSELDVAGIFTIKQTSDKVGRHVAAVLLTVVFPLETKRYSTSCCYSKACLPFLKYG